MKRITSAVLIFILCLSLHPATPAAAASEEAYRFTERIVYGGTAVDYGDFIYYANPDDGMRLYRRTVGRDDAVLIYPNPVGYLNIADERLYFISENKIISVSLSGQDEQVLYAGADGIVDLYATPDCLYFLENGSVRKYKSGTVSTLFTDTELCAFLPLSDTEFRCYKANPDYIEIDQTSAEIYEEYPEKYLTYTYSTRTKTTKTVAAESYKATAEYNGPFVTVGTVTLPLAEYMPGTFFSKNEQACDCHYDPNIDCVASINGCNCMRYWPSGKASDCEIDLLGAQCFAFARFVFYRCFGFIDHPSYSQGLYYSVGSLAQGAVTANTVKELLMKTKTGAHVRLSRGHSVSIFTMDEQYITVYHGNAGGDGVVSQPCVVSTKKFTWEEFAAYAAAGISYANMPYDYPGDNTNPQKKSEGYYRLNSNMNVRAGTSTKYKIMGQLSLGSVIKVLQVSNGWGRIAYGESTNRWISLDYADFISLPAILPKQDSLVQIDEAAGYLIAGEKTDVFTFKNSFLNGNLAVLDSDEQALEDAQYIGTGCVVKMVVDDAVMDSKTVLIKGDANGNGIVDVGDYLMVKRISLGNYQVEGVYWNALDINGDGQIDSMDCLLMKKYLVGTLNSLSNNIQ